MTSVDHRVEHPEARCRIVSRISLGKSLECRNLFEAHLRQEVAKAGIRVETRGYEPVSRERK